MKTKPQPTVGKPNANKMKRKPKPIDANPILFIPLCYMLYVSPTAHIQSYLSQEITSHDYNCHLTVVIIH